MTWARLPTSLRRRQALFLMVVGAAAVFAAITVFAIELSNTQAKSRSDVKARVHERAVLAASLVDSLFQTVQTQVPRDSVIYGAPTVSERTMDAQLQNNLYLALLDSSGRVLAHSRGFTAQVRSQLPSLAALALVRSGHLFGLGDLEPYGKTGAYTFAVTFPTAYGRRTLLSGAAPHLLGVFLTGELRQIPGVKGARNYVIDNNDTVLASTNAKIGVGYRFTNPTQVRALRHASGDRSGHYYDQVRLKNSTWRIVLAAPDGPLFAAVSGLHKWIPWLILVAFAIVAAGALALGARLLRSADQIRVTNATLETVNRELAEANVTLHRRAIELARSNAELEQFASIASHDLQEPLRKVRTFTEQVAVDEAEHLSERGQDYLRRASRAAERMQKLIQDLLQFSRVATQGRPFTSVDLEQLVDEVLSDLVNDVDRSDAAVHVGQLPTIAADALQMRQLLQNLISNALKFRRDGVPLEIAIDAAVADDTIRLSVADNGIGFEPRYAGRIFRVFERLHGRGEYPGTGIGLALCRKIVERHGGSIVAASEPEAGSTFTVTLPLRPAEPVDVAAFDELETEVEHANA